MAKNASFSDTPVALLILIAKQFSTGDYEQREIERQKLVKQLKNADDQSVNCIENNIDNLKKTIQSFGAVASRIKRCREKVQILRDKLKRCKDYLNYSEDDLRRQWQEGIEYSQILQLLGEIDEAVAVPDQIDKLVSKRQYLGATKLLVATLERLNQSLESVEALRDLKSDLALRRDRMHDLLIEEINRQLYSDVRVLPIQRSTGEVVNKTTLANKLSLQPSTPTGATINDFGSEGNTRTLSESVKKIIKPGDEQLYAYICELVEALQMLGKLSDAVESLKGRIQREIALVIHRATDQVAERAVDKGDAPSASQLVMIDDPHLLVELLEIAFQKFRNIAHNHRVLLCALGNVIVPKDYDIIDGHPSQSQVEIFDKDNRLYTEEEIWSAIEFSLKVLLDYYLSGQSRSADNPTMSTFTTAIGDVSSYFAPVRRFPVLGEKTSKATLFRFESSSSAQAMSSYLREQTSDVTSSLPDDPYTESLMSSKPTLLCCPSITNITAVFIPVISFIIEIEQTTSSKLGKKGVLYHYIMETVEKDFLKEIFCIISGKTSALMQDHQVLKNLSTPAMHKALGCDLPLLRNTVMLDESINELTVLMKKLPLYSNNFLEIVVKMLHEFLDCCNRSYKKLVLREEIGKPSRIISASWVRDPDINMYLKVLPNWAALRGDASRYSDDEQRKGIIKESEQLLGILKTAMKENEVILDIADLKSLAHLQESVEWFSGQIKAFLVALTANSMSIHLPESSHKWQDNIIAQIPPINKETLEELTSLSQDFQSLAELYLLVFHLEVRCHCFFRLIPATYSSGYHCLMNAVEVDPLIPQLTKELHDIEEICSAALSPAKCKYIFDGVGHLLSAIVISATAHIPKINRNGVKKMIQNIFTLQQELANITYSREHDLDMARQYYELLYLSPDEVLNIVAEQGPKFKEQEYQHAIELLCRSEVTLDSKLLEVRKRKLTEVLSDRASRQ